MPVAIVTGGNTGIGRACALALADSGHDVGITWEREEPRAETVRREIEQRGRRGALARLDLVDPHAVTPAIDGLAEALGGLDVFVANAGTGGSGPFLEVTLAEWQRIVAVNLTGAFVCAQAAARRMVAGGRGGVIITVTSVHERIPLRGAAPYVAAKHGLGGLTKAMALELGAHGIRVNAVAPGEIATRMTGQEDQPPRATPSPLGRAGHPHEVAALVAWLASPAASYVTGASVAVDGGLLLRTSANA